jgi:succinyl-diaminopimelate desuccinylase
MELEDILRRLVAYPSISGNSTANHELLEYVAEFVTARGMFVRWFNFNGYESIVATTKPDDLTPKVMLAAHADVVPAAPQLLKLRKGNGYYYGRGVLDMKFALAGFMQLIDTLQGDLSSYSLGLMVTTDEELGGWHGVAELLRQGYRPQVCVIPDGGENWQIQTFAKGIYVVDIVAKGASAHGSRPWLGVNAITILLQVYQEIASLFSEHQEPHTNTVTMTRINAGKALTQIPNKATMTVDMRLISKAEWFRIEKAVKAICSKYKVKIQGGVSSLPTEFDLAHPLIAPYAALIEEVTGVQVTGSRTLGQNDGRFFAEYTIPCVSLYPPGADLHHERERLAIPSLQQFYEITLRYVQQIARDAVAEPALPAHSTETVPSLQ